MTPGCSACGTSIPIAAVLERRLVPCPSCRSPVTAEVFPAFLRPLDQGFSGEVLLTADEAGCFYHPQKRAVRPCGGCGRFLCALCDLEVGNEHLCPACLEAGVRAGSMQHLESQRTRYDRIALAVAVIPMFTFYFTLVTAPIAIFLAFYHWRKPGSLVTPSRWRLVVAVILGAAQVIGWVVLIAFLVNRLGSTS